MIDERKNFDYESYLAELRNLEVSMTGRQGRWLGWEQAMCKKDIGQITESNACGLSSAGGTLVKSKDGSLSIKVTNCSLDSRIARARISCSSRPLNKLRPGSVFGRPQYCSVCGRHVIEVGKLSVIHQDYSKFGQAKFLCKTCHALNSL